MTWLLHVNFYTFKELKMLKKIPLWIPFSHLITDLLSPSLSVSLCLSPSLPLSPLSFKIKVPEAFSACLANILHFPLTSYLTVLLNLSP